MPMYEVTLAKRAAKRHLQNEECKIFVEQAHSSFITAPGIFMHDDKESVFVPIEQIIVPLTDITRMEITDRFDNKCMMLVDWDD